MAQLIHITNVSLDMYIEDETGDFSWTEPDDEQFAFVTDLVRPLSTHLYGRRLYESMAVWETDPSFGAASEPNAEFARVWMGATKVVYSRTLGSVPTADTRIERSFDPAAVRTMKETATGDLMVGGAELAAQAFAAGVVDECHLFVGPAVLGRGKRALPDLRMHLELLDERRFANGVVYLRHRVRH